MRKRSTRKSAAATLLESTPAPPSEKEKAHNLSPKNSPTLNFDFTFEGFVDMATSMKKKGSKSGSFLASASKRISPIGLSVSPLRSANSISELKNLATSNLDSLKRHLENSHLEILKDFEASQCRLQKRYKIQTQACQQMADEAEKQYKKMFDGINEGREAMKASYAEFIAEAQASASRMWKTSIPELAKASEKGIDSLRNRFGTLSNTA